MNIILTYLLITIVSSCSNTLLDPGVFKYLVESGESSFSESDYSKVCNSIKSKDVTRIEVEETYKDIGNATIKVKVFSKRKNSIYVYLKKDGPLDLISVSSTDDTGLECKELPITGVSKSVIYKLPFRAGTFDRQKARIVKCPI